MLDISRYPIRPKRSLDQYFLVDERVIAREVDLLDLSSNDTVLEVGPGLGFLTREIAKQARVIAIEKDRLLFNILREEMPDNVEVINADALKIEFSDLKFNKFASNIPYSISKEITLKFLRSDFDIGVIVCQDEFAKKLVAKPGDDSYRAISVIANYYADITLDRIVPRSSFKPYAPVNSRIVVFRKRRKENRDFERFVNMAFSSRRKKLWRGKRPGKMLVDEFIEAFNETFKMSSV